MDLDAERVGASIGGRIERPIRMTSHLEIEASVDSLELGELRNIVQSLPGGSADTFADVAARIESGSIPIVVGRGNARLSRWDRLFEGRVSQLPQEFSVEGRVEGFDFNTGPSSKVERFESNVSLDGDVFRVLDTHGVFDETPIPEIDLTVRGVSHLFRSATDDVGRTAEASNLPGLDALLGLFAADDPTQPIRFPSTRLMIDSLEHPTLRWPVRDARLQIEGIENGFAIDFEEAIWAGSPVEGRATWLGWPDRSITGGPLSGMAKM